MVLLLDRLRPNIPQVFGVHLLHLFSVWIWTLDSLAHHKALNLFTFIGTALRRLGETLFALWCWKLFVLKFSWNFWSAQVLLCVWYGFFLFLCKRREILLDFSQHFNVRCCEISLWLLRYYALWSDKKYSLRVHVGP